MVGPTSASSWSNTVGDIRKYIWSENCPHAVHSQGDDIRQAAVASELCHESILPAAVVQFFDEYENMRKLEVRQHDVDELLISDSDSCHYQTPFLSNGAI